MLQFWFASLLRIYNWWTPVDSEAILVAIFKFVISVEGVTLTGFAFPKPGSVSKKYSSAIILDEDEVAVGIL